MPKQPSAAKRLKILVVDDEPFVCDSVKMLLEFDGHTVETAPNAAQALQIFKKGEFDLIMTDLMMPNMKGDELALRTRELAPKQPIVMITAHAEMLNPPVKGIDYIVSKPFLLEDLREAIAKTLGKLKTSPSKK